MRKRTQVNQITDSNPMIIEWTVMRKNRFSYNIWKVMFAFYTKILEIRIAVFHFHAIENKNQNHSID